jgi:hypothetical protein
MGPHRPESWRSLPCGLDLSEAPTDLQVGPKTLYTTPVTLEDPWRPYPDLGRPAWLVAQISPLGRGTALPVGPRITGSAL